MRRTTAAWACLAAVGVGYFVTGLALAIRELALPLAREAEMALTGRTIYISGVPDAVLFALALAAGGAAAAYAGRRAGGGLAVVLYSALVAVAGALLVAESITREQRLRSGECCVVVGVADFPLATAAMFLPAAVLIGFGAALARSRAPQSGTNPFLEAAGAYAVAGALAVLAFGVPASALVFAPYASVQLESVPHALTLIFQVVVAAAVYAVRGGVVAQTTFVVFGAMGLAGVAYFDLLEIWFTLFLDHKYVPVSLPVVPVASALLGPVAVGAVRSILRTRDRAIALG